MMKTIDLQNMEPAIRVRAREKFQAAEVAAIEMRPIWEQIWPIIRSLRPKLASIKVIQINCHTVAFIFGSAIQNPFGRNQNWNQSLCLHRKMQEIY